ncbi:MAG: hypothetical protein J6W85_06450 [Lachnospiraceae bacterium]|nr:hypothetical protein [Lachnospiraceae bacterium]
MKRKIYLVLMSVVMCSSVLFSGCGKQEETAQEVVSEEDDEEEEEDDKPVDTKIPEIVEEIRDKDLETQLDVFLEDRESWQIPRDVVAQYDSVGYYVTDLDHNGRIELLTACWSSEYEYTENRIYEINEEGNGYYLIETETSGMDTDEDISPDMATCISPYSYFDKGKQAFHYLIEDYSHNYDETVWTTRYTDVTLLDGTLYVDVYAVSEMNYAWDDGDPVCTYRLPKEEIAENDFYEYVQNFPEGKVRKQYYYGAYRDRSGYDEMCRSLEEIGSDELKNIFTDSYHVFTGRMDDDEFYDTYNSDGKPELYANMFDASVGNWEITSVEIEGSVTEYYWGFPQFYKLQISSNAQAVLEAYDMTTLDYTVVSPIVENEYGNLVFEDDIVARTGSTLDWGAAKHVYEIAYVDDENLELYYDVYDLSGEWLTGSYWVFTRVEE